MPVVRCAFCDLAASFDRILAGPSPGSILRASLSADMDTARDRPTPTNKV
jgi:hypothetical protein